MREWVAFLRRKLGPAPVWAWALILGVAMYLAVRYFRGRAGAEGEAIEADEELGAASRYNAAALGIPPVLGAGAGSALDGFAEIDPEFEEGIAGLPGGEVVRVPSVIGQRTAVARGFLTAAGLGSTVRTRPVRDRAKVGKVLQQSPGPGSLVQTGSRVELTVGERREGGGGGNPKRRRDKGIDDDRRQPTGRVR